MGSDRKPSDGNRIPIRFPGDDGADEDFLDEAAEPEIEILDQSSDDESTDSRGAEVDSGGPALAELIASRAELKRLQTEVAEARDGVARRQADFENYRKRVERERNETHNRVVSELARKLLPVVDNLARALDAEKSIEAGESKEFRHFLSGIELINKQLSEVLESLGIQPIVAVGERFDPHIHEAVATEPSDEYEPDTEIEELARGYRLGDRLVRPAMVKVAAQKSDE